MGKRNGFFMALGALSLAMAGAASAATFSDTMDFAGDGTSDGATYIQIEDVYSYKHTLPGLTTPPDYLESATLWLRHNGNSNTKGEVWFSAEGGSGILVGRLSESSEDNKWVIDRWDLSEPILYLMESSTPWELTVDLYDTTSGTDKIILDYSILEGTYTINPSPNPVPVPGAAVLLGSALTGIIGMRRKKNA